MELILFLIGCIFVIGDFVFTRINIKKNGSSAELNPFMRGLATKSIYHHIGAELGAIAGLFVFSLFDWYVIPFTLAGIILVYFIGGFSVAIYSNILTINVSSEE
jgi:hypothetical protein